MFCLTALVVILVVLLVAACIKIEQVQAEVRFQMEEYDRYSTKMYELLGNLNKRRDGAYALRAAADKWEDPLYKPALERMAHDHYEPGGPSMPAIFMRLEADALSGIPQIPNTEEPMYNYNGDRIN